MLKHKFGETLLPMIKNSDFFMKTIQMNVHRLFLLQLFSSEKRTQTRPETYSNFRLNCLFFSQSVYRFFLWSQILWTHTQFELFLFRFRQNQQLIYSILIFKSLQTNLIASIKIENPKEAIQWHDLPSHIAVPTAFTIKNTYLVCGTKSIQMMFIVKQHNKKKLLSIKKCKKIFFLNFLFFL